MHRQVLNEVLMQNMLDSANSWDLMADGEFVRSAGDYNAHDYFLTHESLSGKGGGTPLAHKPHRSREQDL